MDSDVSGAPSAPPPDPPSSAPLSSSDRLAALSPAERLTWRKTGQLPGSTSAAPASEGSSEAAADRDSAPAAAAGESAPPAAGEESAPPAQPDQPSAPRRKQTAAERLHQVLADRAYERQLREQAEARIRVLEGQIPRSPPSAAPPPARAAPPDLSQFQDYAEYTRALTAYEVQQAIAAERTRVAQEQAQAQAAQAQAARQQTWQTRVDHARTKYADFDQVALEADTAIPPGSLIDAWIWDSDDGPEVLYHLQQHPAEVTRLQTLTPFQQVRELALLGASLTAPPSSRRTASTAPAPPPTLGSRGTTSDPVAQAVKTRDFAAYRDAMNRRELEARRVR